MSKIILFSTIKLYKGNSAGSARVMNYARALSQKCNVYLISFYDYHKIRKIDFVEVEKNIFVYTTENELSSYRKINKIIKPFLLLVFVLKINNLFGKLEGDTTFFLYPSTQILLDYYALLIIKIIKKKRLFLEVNELRKYSSIFDEKISLLRSPLKTINRTMLFYKYSKYEKLSKYFDGLICISRNLVNYYRKYNSNIIRVPILSNPDQIDLDRKFIEYKRNDIFNIGFFGSINFEKENLGLLFQSINELNKKGLNISLSMYGFLSGSLDSFYKRVTDFSVKGIIKYNGVLPQEEVIKNMSQFHLLILPRGNNMQNHFGFSTKLSEYLVSGVPVLVTDVSDNALYIKDGFNGFIIPPDDLKAMINKLEWIIINFNNLSHISNNSILLVKEQFVIERYKNKLISFIC